MILPIDRKPEYSIFYLGAIALQILNAYEEIDLTLLHTLIEEKIKLSISIDYFYYTADWLYLLGQIEIKNEKIVKCILKE